MTSSQPSKKIFKPTDVGGCVGGGGVVQFQLPQLSIHWELREEHPPIEPQIKGLGIPCHASSLGEGQSS